MESTEIIQSKTLDHLGIVAGVCEEIGLVSLIDKLTGSDPQRKVSVGQCIYAMVLNGLGFAHEWHPCALYQERKRLEKTGEQRQARIAGAKTRGRKSKVVPKQQANQEQTGRGRKLQAPEGSARNRWKLQGEFETKVAAREGQPKKGSEERRRQRKRTARKA